MAGRIERQETRAVRQKRSLTRKIKHNNWKVENHKMYVIGVSFLFLYFMVRGGGNYKKTGMDAFFSERWCVNAGQNNGLVCLLFISSLWKNHAGKRKAGGGLKRPCRTGHCKKRHRAFFFHLHIHTYVRLFNLGQTWHFSALHTSPACLCSARTTRQKTTSKCSSPTCPLLETRAEGESYILSVHSCESCSLRAITPKPGAVECSSGTVQ